MSGWSRRRGRWRVAFTLIELLVVMAVIVLLLAILLPGLAGARERARSVACMANLHEIGIAHLSYATMFDGCIVPGEYDVPATSSVAETTSEMWFANFVDVGVIPMKQTSAASSASVPPVRGTVFCCPSGAMDALSTETPHTTNDIDAARPRRGNSTLLKASIDCWYGMNGGTSAQSTTVGDNCHTLPGRRIPTDGTTNDFVLARILNVPPDVVLFYDGVFMNQAGVNPFRVNGRHFNGTETNLMMVDGHAEGISRKLIPGGLATGYVADPSTLCSQFWMPTVAAKFGKVRWVLPESVP